mgnify:FL=1|tara:strand:- start:676 stop:1011 length:336 start_codon:yes stop_codon:yes gene_type:complete
MAKEPTYFQERRDFIARMLAEQPKGAYAREMKFTKEIFSSYNIDFLKVVAPPFELNSLAYLISQDGKKYLSLQEKIWLYKPEKHLIIEQEDKVGEDWNGKRKKGFREFLNE